MSFLTEPRSRTEVITTAEVERAEGASDQLIGEDILYTRFTGVPPPAILVRNGDTYLTIEKKSNKTNEPFFLEQVFFSDYGYANMPFTQTNYLVFSFPEENINSPTNEKFGERVITFQEYIPDVNDPNYPKVADPNAETYPIYLIRDMIEEDPNEMGIIVLPDIPKKRYAGTWHNFILRTDIPTRELAMADFNEDGIVDVNDRLMLEGCLGYEGNSRYDIASLKDPLAEPNTPNYGLISIGTNPDYIVDSTDKTAFEEMMIADEKRRGVYDPNSE